jgi:hypothetical protein
MRRIRLAALPRVVTLASAVILIPAQGYQEQQAQVDCRTFHAVVQGALPTPTPFAPTDTWGGPIYASLGGESLIGGVSGNDGTQHGEGAAVTFTGGVYKVCFGAGSAWGGASDCANGFTYEVPEAQVVWPTADWLGSYRATARIAGGTGRFARASGQLTIPAGSFITWPDETSPIKLRGRWNGAMSGQVCGVQ